MTLAVIILGILVVVLLFVVLRRPAGTSGESLLLKQDLRQLSEDVTKLQTGLQTQMTTSMQQQFNASNKIIADITRNLVELKESNKQVLGITDELKTLQNVLQNPKQRGVLGEYHLQSVLENVLPPERFKLQYKFKDGEIVDAVVMLDKGRILPVDSKFSLENYNRLVEETDKAKRDVHARAFKQDLKTRIDETSKYVRPKEGTMDYAFMFIPSEAIYYDLLVNKVVTTGTSARDLIEYAFRDKNVIIVSPTTFMAYLQTVLQGLRSLQIEEQAKEIQQRVGELGRHISTYDVFMQKLGNSLGTTVNHYNAAHKELKKIDKDVVKIANNTPSVEPLLIDKPVQDHDD